MRIERHHDPVEFRRRVAPLLLRDEPRHNLELAILGRLASGGSFGDEEPVLLAVGDEGAAFMTPPHNLLLGAVPYDAAGAVAEYAAAEGLTPPGALGAPETVTAFAERYAALSGRSWEVSREEGVYALRSLVPPRPVSGTSRLATEADLGVVSAWVTAFQEECRLRPVPDERTRELVDDGLTWLWVDGGEPVSLACCGGSTPNGARVGPVYTPPALRGRGYASAVTAAVTEALLGRGLAYTFLYTDLANPTSNKIYRALGYEHVCDVREVTFGG